MGISTDRDWRRHLIFASMILMLAGVFTSRAMLSGAMILFLVSTCIHRDFIQQLLRFVKNPFLLGMAFLFFIPLTTGLWSEDKQVWWRFVRIKLPLLLLPVGFAGNWRLSAKQWNRIGFVFLAMVVAGCCWSLWQYAENMQVIHLNYLKAKVIPTPFENDHVRFSLVVALAIISAGLLMKQLTQKTTRFVLGTVMFFLAVYLHILSVRTGLAAFYLALAAGVVHMVLRFRKKSWTLVLSGLLILMPVAAWLLLPTFRNRIRYVLYDLSLIRNDQYLPGANDGNRMMSIKAGWNILQQHPFGVGSGDVMEATSLWYRDNLPQMPATDKLYPSSEWLMYGAAAGWPGIICFTVIMLLPFFEKVRERFFWYLLGGLMAFSFLFDIGLEVQFGVFIYAFLMLCWWKQLRNGSPVL